MAWEYLRRGHNDAANLAQLSIGIDVDHWLRPLVEAAVRVRRFLLKSRSTFGHCYKHKRLIGISSSLNQAFLKRRNFPVEVIVKKALFLYSSYKVNDFQSGDFCGTTHVPYSVIFKVVLMLQLMMMSAVLESFMMMFTGVVVLQHRCDIVHQRRVVHQIVRVLLAVVKVHQMIATAAVRRLIVGNFHWSRMSVSCDAVHLSFGRLKMLFIAGTVKTLHYICLAEIPVRDHFLCT